MTVTRTKRSVVTFFDGIRRRKISSLLNELEPLHAVIRRHSQRESWIQFVSSITSSTSSKHLWKKVKAANGVYKEFSIPVLNTGHASYSSPLDVANILGQTFAQFSAADSYNFAFVAIKNRAERMTSNFSSRRPFPYNCEFRMFELKADLSKAHDSSPGSDGIAYSMLRHLNSVSLSNILYLFNRVWREQFPTPMARSCCDSHPQTRKRGIHLDPIRNDAIPIVDEIRFLGVIFDRKLTFLPHILQLRKKCEKSLNILKVLSCTSWGADRTSLLRIYQAVILSRIDYGCLVYGSARSAALRRLDT
ncbi:hypothetical protein AVEN_140791-1, partial [Araneus ventricosus]